MMHDQGVMNTTPPLRHCGTKCFSWSAVFVGAFIGVGLSFLLNLFSLAIGLSAFTTTSSGITAFAVGGFLGFLIGGIASMFVAGFVAGYLGRPFSSSCNSGCLYGFIAWSLTLILGVMLSGPASKFITANSSYITNHALTVINLTPTQNAIVSDTPTVVVDPEKAASDAAKAAFALFVIFFTAALASTFGGHYGMECRKKCCPDNKTECTK